MADKDDSAAALIERARKAATRAYAPYSGFSVGCAIEAEDGSIATGSNMENACYRLGTCAEISALTSAQQAFGLSKIRRIAVAGGHLGDDGMLVGAQAVTPCGGCRQAIAEASDLADHDIQVISASGDGETVSTTTIAALLPASFGPKNLKDADG
ncbi:cytidine deaminase [Parasphingopyxis sp. CP4]|uniref:cytidine deaminase n=1 Tax=Parasphingopyxis sp. CP4 TaxID=2724527 RepID=UPI0015A373CD|nr:cytidine deaminase [Parasphingopyxis sp. CP4]QLC23054.1 cytidine deaminase [Parasphingopyxis sp. CP4]